MNNVVVQTHLKDLLKSVPQPKIEHQTKTQQVVGKVNQHAVVKPNTDPAVKN